MSALNGNWKIYTDPVYMRDKDSVLKAKLPAGAKMFFQAKSVDALLWVLNFVAPDLFFRKERTLEGFDLTTKRRVAEFYGSSFRVIDGLGSVVDGQYEVEGLRTNEPYTEWLLGLTWRAPRGWKTEMHAIALASAEDNGIIWSYDESRDELL